TAPPQRRKEWAGSKVFAVPRFFGVGRTWRVRAWGSGSMTIGSECAQPASCDQHGHQPAAVRAAVSLAIGSESAQPTARQGKIKYIKMVNFKSSRQPMQQPSRKEKERLIVSWPASPSDPSTCRGIKFVQFLDTFTFPLETPLSDLSLFQDFVCGHLGS